MRQNGGWVNDKIVKFLYLKTWKITVIHFQITVLVDFPNFDYIKY